MFNFNLLATPEESNRGYSTIAPKSSISITVSRGLPEPNQPTLIPVSRMSYSHGFSGSVGPRRRHCAQLEGDVDKEEEEDKGREEEGKEENMVKR